MNQTKKRLAIIKLAISMTDTETIQLQVLKLGLLKTDSRMRDILALLNEHNYAQAQRLISQYIDSPNETTIIQRTSQDNVTEATTQVSPEEAMIEKKETNIEETTESQPLTLKEKIKLAKEKALIEQFELFAEASENIENEGISEAEDYDAYLDISPKPKKMSTETINYDSLLNVDAQDVLPDNITLDISEDKEDFFNKELSLESEEIEDAFFSSEEEEIDSPEKPIFQEEIQIEEEPLDKNSAYKAISYIDQKFKNMLNQYPPVHASDTDYPSINAWLLKIANDGYSELDIEEIIKHIETLSVTDKSEAAQLLLITAATESKYAQFRLARELYKGTLLEKNLPESFTLINRLAMNDNYPEALCDLAQFYESGIGITKDKKRAEELYKEAMELGINRAIDHYERLHKENKSLLSFLKK